MADGFAGFPKDFFAFFRELKANNNRAWFEDNKQRYRDSVQAPTGAFVSAMAPEMKKISKHFICDPKPNGGSAFRIYRDIRFSKDKRPYKENAGCFFQYAGSAGIHAPGFYMHFAANDVRYGGGSYMPEAPALAKIREAIVAKPAAWKKIEADKLFKKTFGEISGDALSRPPRGYDPQHPLIETIKRKSFFAIHPSTMALAQSPKLVADVASTFRAATPLMKFLCAAQGVPF